MSTENLNTNEETIVENPQMSSDGESVKPEESKETTWRNVLIGGIPGIALGAAGSLWATNAYAGTGEAETVDPSSVEPTGLPVINDVAQVAHSVNDDMSFGEAFAAARNEVGPGGVFVWHGNAYSTYTEAEWNAMDADARHEYAQSVHSAFDGHIPAGNTNEEQHSGNGNNEHQENGEQEHNGNHDEIDHSGEEPEIQIFEVGAVDNGDGTVSYYGAGEIDGHYAEFQDLDGDGNIDQLIVDANDNGEVDDGEIISTAGSDITVDDLLMVAEMEQDMPDDNLYAETPDYTNDADISSLA